MGTVIRPAQNAGKMLFSRRLKRNLAGLSESALVELNAQSGGFWLTTESDSQGQLPLSFPDGLGEVPGRLTACVAETGDDALAPELPVPADPALNSHTFRISFDCGMEDRLQLVLRETADIGATAGVLAAIWPVLREDCLRDILDAPGEECDNALLWMIASKIDVAILVMNSHGAMLRANAAAKQLLESEVLLRRTPRGICCIHDQQTRQFRKAIADSAAAPAADPETVLFLDTVTPGLRVPVTMSRYWHDGAPTDLVTVMMPTPPDPRRVEMLARAVGLTPAEARVASLLQMGLSNKDAAKLAGLKEQSVSTYAKRVLSKLNVTSRAEMAQMLTWQAVGGRL